MKQLFLFGVLGACAVGSACAQDQYTYQMADRPIGMDAYCDVIYYSNGKSTLNLRNNVIAKTDSLVKFKVSPDGSTLAAITADKKGLRKSIKVFKLWDSNKKLASLDKPGFTPSDLCYSSDSGNLLVIDTAGNVHSLALPSLKETAQIQTGCPDGQIYTTPDGYYLVFVSNNQVYLWNSGSYSLKHTFTHSAKVNGIAISDDSQKLAVVTADGRAWVYSLSTLQPTNQIDALGLAKACSFQTEGKYLSVVTGDSKIAVINLFKESDRSYIDAPASGIDFLRFAKDPASEGEYLMFNGGSEMVFRNMDYLSPYRGKLIADRLQERMEIWEQRLPGESFEEYQLRVNDLTRQEQMMLFEQEIASELALEELGMAEMMLGRYNPETQMLAVGLGEGLGDIFLSMPPQDVQYFLNPNNLEFNNVIYGLNDNDEYELLYADVYNKANGKTYKYDNTTGLFIDYLVDDSTYAPLELVSQTTLEENSLSSLTDDIVTKAMEENILSDHTHVDVSTRIVPSTDAQGNPIRNYEVNVSYTVDADYSAKEDYGLGKYMIQDSPAGMAMLNIVQQAFHKDFAKYMQPGKKVDITITGSADAIPVKNVIKYTGCYGDIVDFPIIFNGEEHLVTVTPKTGIRDNEQLATLRAIGVKDYLFNENPVFNKMDKTVTYDIEVSDKVGGEYRKVGLKFVFINAFDNN